MKKGLFKIISLFNRDAKIIYNSMKQLELPKDQLFIHDDELCPCGSGKMFSNCCKNKPDSGPTNSPKPTKVLLMERMRKSLRKRRLCLHPDQTRCQGDIKEAHALQNHKIISLLASSDNHVMMQDHTKQPIIVNDDPLNPVVIVPFSKVSGNKATTQSCFCDLHDTELFKPIEAGAPDFDPDNEEMRFVYAYTSKVLYYFNLLLPLFSENLVISEKLWDNHSEKGQFGLVHMAALIGTDQFNLSHTIGMALRNAAKNKKMDYSKRGEIDLFQTI